MYDDKLSWKENILAALGEKKWRSRRQIKNFLGLDYKTEPMKTRAINSYLLRLTHSGHVVRANAPDVLKDDPLDHIHYVYKWTGKKFIPCYDTIGKAHSKHMEKAALRKKIKQHYDEKY